MNLARVDSPRYKMGEERLVTKGDAADHVLIRPRMGAVPLNIATNGICLMANACCATVMLYKCQTRLGPGTFWGFGASKITFAVSSIPRKA